MASTTKETSLNSKLAECLRQYGLDALEEQTLRSDSGQLHQVDVLVNLDEYAVALEAEYAPQDGKADAAKRLTDPPLEWRGVPVDVAYAIAYPANIKDLPPPLAYEELFRTDNLRFKHLSRASGTWSAPATGAVSKLADVLHDFWTQSDNGQDIYDVAELASVAINKAANFLERHHKESGEKDSDPAATKALVWLNALLFQVLLHQSLNPDLLPPPHTGKRIPLPNPDEGGDHLSAQWKEILTINWWPIFHVARESLNATAPLATKRALDVLKTAATEIAETGVIRRHDVAGRIFHRLLDTRKFLATNYTTIPAAIILSALAFDRRHSTWKDMDFTSKQPLEQLKIVDPACGSGTLLMAAFQEIIKHIHIQNERRPDSDLTKCVLENSLYGFDVVPAAIHLAASTLLMAETSQLVSDLNLWRMQHGVFDGLPRLGSLDMLHTSSTSGNAARLGLFNDFETDAIAISGKGEEAKTDVFFPRNCDLVIANPPYTRAGGPGDEKNTDWNPIFGSLINKKEQEQMKNALNRTLQNTPAGVYSGLGSAFLVLAHHNIRGGGRIAFVLPSVLTTGSSWKPIREMLLANYQIDWVITSHDPRTRSAKAGLPGRMYASFSESTNMAEVLLVATKEKPLPSHKVRFVNLKTNPLSTIDALAVARALLEMPEGAVDLSTSGASSWGQVHTVYQQTLTDEPWVETSFVQSDLIDMVHQVEGDIPLSALGGDWMFGPYEMQIKNKNQGLFLIDKNPDPLRSGYAALWHHKANEITQLSVSPNAHLTPRHDKSPSEQQKMLAKSSKLHFARELRSNTQRLAAVLTDQPLLGVRSWITLKPKSPKEGALETICLWFNSTLGLLMRLTHANRPYPGRSLITHTTIPSLKALDVSSLTKKQCNQGKKSFQQIQEKTLQPFHQMNVDKTRQEIDAVLCHILGLDPEDIAKIRNMLVREPLVNAGK